MSAGYTIRMSAEEVDALLTKVFPQSRQTATDFEIAEVFPGGCRVRLVPADRHLRPGGTISGPALFTLADMAAYVAVLSHLGPYALAVTTNLNINFMRKSEPRPVVGDCRILKLGQRLVVVDVAIRQEDADELIAHASATYSVPPRHDGAAAADIR